MRGGDPSRARPLKQSWRRQQVDEVLDGHVGAARRRWRLAGRRRCQRRARSWASAAASAAAPAARGGSDGDSGAGNRRRSWRWGPAASRRGVSLPPAHDSGRRAWRGRRARGHGSVAARSARAAQDGAVTGPRRTFLARALDRLRVAGRPVGQAAREVECSCVGGRAVRKERFSELRAEVVARGASAHVAGVAATASPVVHGGGDGGGAAAGRWRAGTLACTLHALARAGTACTRSRGRPCSRTPGRRLRRAVVVDLPRAGLVVQRLHAAVRDRVPRHPAAWSRRTSRLTGLAVPRARASSMPCPLCAAYPHSVTSSVIQSASSMCPPAVRVE